MLQVCDSVRRARPLLGTFVEVQIARCKYGSEEAIEAAFGAVADVHKLMSFHDPDSDVSRLNRDAYRDAVQVAPWTYAVLETAIELHRVSNGLFDISVADRLQRVGLLPDDGGPREATSQASTEHISLLADGWVRYLRQGVRIDLGGIAKGFAVDCAIDVLKQYGASSGLVNAGGDMRAFGPEHYEVSIRNPRHPAHLMSRTSVCDEALATSGQRLDLIQSPGIFKSAVIDPICSNDTHDVFGATVRATSCIHADALTKVVMLAGEQSAPILEHYGASAMFVKANGEICASADWRESDFLAA